MDRTEGSRRWLWVHGLVVIAAALPFLPTLGWGLLAFDDPQYVTNQPYWAEPTLSTLWDAVRRPVFSNYQPLHLASYWLDRLVWGPNAWGLRLTQLGLYVGCVAALLRVARRLALPEVGVAVAALVFAWHPAHVESVAWVSQRKDVLSTLLLLLSLAAWLGPGPRPLTDPAAPADPRGRALALLLFGLALLAKTQAVVLAPLLIVLAWGRRSLRRDLPWLAAVVALAALASVVALRVHASWWSPEAAGPPPGAARALRVALALGRYARTAVAPTDLTPLPPWPGPDLTPAEGLGLALLALLLAAIVASAARGRVVAVLGLWFLGALGPVCGLVSIPTFAQDRYLFVPSLALALGAGLLVAAAGRVRARRFPALLVAGVALLGLFHQTWGYAPAWRTDVDLWSWAVRQHPGDVRVREQLAAGLFERGDPRGERAAREVLAQAPDSYRANLIIARAHLTRGEVEPARAHLERASRTPGAEAFRAALILADLARLDGDLAAASAWIDRAAERAPPLVAEVHAARGQVALSGGRFDEAAACLERAVGQLPEWSEAWAALACAERLAGRADRARAAADRARGLDGVAARAHLALDAGDLDTAQSLLGAGDGARHLELALARARLASARGRPDEARALLAPALAEGPGVRARVALEADLLSLGPPGGR